MPPKGASAQEPERGPSFDRSSKNRLTERTLPRFTGATLFDRIARAVCRAGCLPRKELYEAWEVARRVRRRFRGGRVVDLACGHGLLAQLLLLLDDSSRVALAVDRRIPASASRLADSLRATWPRLDGRVSFAEAEIQAVPLGPEDLVVSVHACGALTDRVLERALSAGARVAVLPCCHDLRESKGGELRGWLDGSLAQDVARATGLRQAGYEAYTGRIPQDITPQNRLLLGQPRRARASDQGQGGTARRPAESRPGGSPTLATTPPTR
jgi:SAM-dependent methyltransferase